MLVLQQYHGPLLYRELQDTLRQQALHLNLLIKAVIQFIIERINRVFAPGSEHISRSVVYHSYDVLLGFWTHRLNIFYIFSDFHKYMMHDILSILFRAHMPVCNVIRKTAVGFINRRKFRFVIRRFNYRQIN